MADGKNISEKLFFQLDNFGKTNIGNRNNYNNSDQIRRDLSENKGFKGDWIRKNDERKCLKEHSGGVGGGRNNDKRESEMFRDGRGTRRKNPGSERDRENEIRSFSGRNRRMMKYTFLESLLDQELSFVLPTLASPKSGFQELLNNRPINRDLLILIIKVLNHVIESEIQQLKIQILSETFTPEFIDEIKEYIIEICGENDPCRLDSIESFFKNILSLFQTVIDLFPSQMNEKLKSVMIAMNLSMKNAKDMPGIRLCDGLFDQLNSITNQISSYLEHKKKINIIQEHKTGKGVSTPSNFRELPLVPVREDFMCEKAFLRHNIVKGSYKDVEHYLDVQFRLLREDFIAPLRTGIHEYIGSLLTQNSKRKYSNIKIYPKIQFRESCQFRDVFGFVICFDCDKKLPRNISWEYSKRFTVGCLLLFSDDNFQTFYLATVIERNTEELQEGRLCVAFVPGTNTPDHIFEPGSFFVMAESEVYYEAYRPVLSALKRINEKNFPMKKYIVDVDTNCCTPAYIGDKSVYQISDYKIKLLDEDSWPTPSQLQLNPSQHRAFKSALTNDFVAIQGPPGTGKTFLALKITEMLLKNNVSKGTPILVVCYTNHALDQFLEGILKCTDNLIRIGSRSRNETLVDYNIDEIRKRKRFNKTLCMSDLYWTTVEEKKELYEMLYNIEKTIYEINMPKGILKLEILKSVVTSQQYDELNGQEMAWLLWYDAPDLYFQIESSMNKTSNELEGQPTEHHQPGDVFKHLNNFQKEEEWQEGVDDDDDDIARLFSDMIEDDFIYERFFRVTINQIRGSIDENNNQLASCKLPENSETRFYFERGVKEHIQQMSIQINFIQKQLSKMKNLEFDPKKFEMLQNVTSVWEIHPQDRWEYYMTWIYLYSCKLKQRIQQLTEKYQNTLLKLYEIKQLEDLSFVRKADVVGLTTSGAALRRVLLENLNTRIVIVEEAAEVLEAHIVTSLTQSVEHVILIGDHKQLKPNPAVYELAKKFNMDVSLFERMLNNGLNCSVLSEQHRMRPEIASLISPTIYPNLDNHPSTIDRPKISGVNKFVFFLTHNYPEDQLPDSSSQQNRHEANFLMALCQYLLLQGYKPEEITILSPYMGQVWCMKKERRRLANQNRELLNVRITPVDNYQGEENRIILLSLVRSNTEAKIGFLSTENRACVALSRARDGLYIVGNMDNLIASSTIWPRIKQRLDEIGAVGRQLTLRCERHPDQLTQVSAAEDFCSVPEGGCSLPCAARLNCGHTCPRVCHIIDHEHAFYQCQERCDRPPCPVEGHKCVLRCCQPCEPCKIPVEKPLPCGHTARMACHREPASHACVEPVPVTLPACGHLVNKPCYKDVDSCKCSHQCVFRLDCGHACTERCHVTKDPEHIEFKCMKSCAKPNVGCKRNHPCKKSCHEPCGDCEELVSTDLPCGHRESIACSKDVSTVQCKKPCTKMLSCGHDCSLQCWLTCDPAQCTKLVDKVGACGHTFKAVNCNKETEPSKCKEPCTRTLVCGHPCPGKCLEDCTKVMCKQPVQSLVPPACGHARYEIPCHLNKQDLNAGSDELLKLCKSACGQHMACGHVCTGSCGECMQGRLHVPCQQRCNKRLICGHQCAADCKVLCPPCQSKECFNNCSHRKCNTEHQCTKPCDPCTRPCIWQCVHLKCTKKCGEECNRPACDEPCTELLGCGHPCMGYCGEQHPTLCRVCHPDNPVIAANPEARFVLLEDCNHVIDAIHLGDIMNAAKKTNVVRLMKCPECNKPIVKTLRYRHVYNCFRKQFNRMSRLINEETPRLRRMLSQHSKLLQSSPTNSTSMNELLSKCVKSYGGNFPADQSRLIIGCLLQTLATKCSELKENEKQKDARRLGRYLDLRKSTMTNPTMSLRVLTPEEQQRLRLRLDYLASALQLRVNHISYSDIVQLELEVGRILRMLEKPNLSHYWYDATAYTWQKDRKTMAVYILPPLNKFSFSLRTRDAVKQWYQCDKDHLYVSENGEPCDTCRIYNKEQMAAHWWEG